MGWVGCSEVGGGGLRLVGRASAEVRDATGDFSADVGTRHRERLCGVCDAHDLAAGCLHTGAHRQAVEVDAFVAWGVALVHVPRKLEHNEWWTLGNQRWWPLAERTSSTADKQFLGRRRTRDCHRDLPNSLMSRLNTPPSVTIRRPL